MFWDSIASFSDQYGCGIGAAGFMLTFLLYSCACFV